MGQFSMEISSVAGSVLNGNQQEGKIGGFAAQYPVGQARIALDMAVRALEGKLEMPYVFPQPTVITSEELKAMDLNAMVAAPEGFSAVYSVAAP